MVFKSAYRLATSAVRTVSVPRVFLLVVLALLISAAPGSSGLAAEAGAPHLDGGELGLIWVVPFAGILLSIALMPLIVPHFWHENFGRVSLFWSLAFLVPFALLYGWELALFEVLHVGLLEYIPFILLLLALFTVAGGVRLKGRLVGTPIVNTGLLAFGTAIASLMGTTGAAMLLIRPLLRANEHRRSQVHVVVFFIFLVANIGGSLTPLGDPPLFLGFLLGVDFFWPTTHIFLPMLFMAGILLTAFFLLDSWFARRDPAPPPATGSRDEALGIEGWHNVGLLFCVMGAVLFSGVWKPGIGVTVFHVRVELQTIVTDVLLLGIAILSYRLTTGESRRRNSFSWAPILEVAKLFAGIFVTIVPAIAILKAGRDGSLGFVVDLVTTPDGQPIPAMYFWLTGILSSFLDNAPTYLVFFNTAGGNAQVLMTQLSSVLLAISCGAVFMGANTYIGNAPNFMVKAIAEERGVPMPSFFAYMGWSIVFLLPVFGLLTLLFFTG